MTHSIEHPWAWPETESIDINDKFETWAYELAINGNEIDWAYWSTRTSITSEQAAKLTYSIEAKEGDSEKRRDPPEKLLLKVRDKAAWLDDHCKEWSLKSLVEVLGEDASIRMREAASLDNTALQTVENEADSIVNPRRKLKPLERETNEGLLLIYEITKRYNVEYLDDLPGPKAWGKIVSGEFSCDLIKAVSDTKKSITLNGGEKLGRADFKDKYRRRFK